MTKKVLVLLDAQLGPNFWNRFCAVARARKGYEFVSMAEKRSIDELPGYDRSLFSRHISLTEAVESYPAADPDVPADADVIHQLERASGETFIDLLQADRSLGAPFLTSAWYCHRTQRSRDATYERSASYALGLMRRIEAAIEDVKPDLALGYGVASIEQKLIFLMLRQKGIPVRLLWSARFENQFLWCDNERRNCTRLTERFLEKLGHLSGDEQADNGSDPAARMDGYNAQKLNHQRYKRSLTVGTALRHMATDLWREAHYWLRSALDGVRANRDTRYGLGGILNVRWRNVWNYRIYARFAESDLSNIAGSEYVFVPLQLEPEAALGVRATRFNNQLALIDLVAKAVPFGVKLVIKEHPAMFGYRPARFYRWISDLPHSILADMSVGGAELARNSLTTATISSTAGFEAATSGVPVINFSANNLYSCLDHVDSQPNFAELPAILRRNYEQRHDAGKRRRDARIFLEALREVSIDLQESELWPGGRGLVSDEAAERLLASLAASLEPADAEGRFQHSGARPKDACV